MIELDEIQDQAVISSIESDIYQSKKETRGDKCCNIICVIGLCLVLCSGILMIPAASIFIGFASVDLVVDEAEKTLQERGMDALRNQISDLEIQPIEGSADFSLTTVDYRMDNFRIQSFYLNEEQTTFDITINGIVVDSKKDRVTILFDWEYQERKLNVRDDGTATAISNNLELEVVFKLEGTSAIRVTSCDLTLKDFELDFHSNGNASWLYDAAVNFFKSTVTSQIEKQVCDKLEGKKFDF